MHAGASMSKKKVTVSLQLDALLAKLQPGFRTKKKEALADFSFFFFSKRSETISKEDAFRLFVGEGKKIGLLAVCGKRSKSSGSMQRAANRAVELIAGLLDRTKNPTDWFLFQQVFLNLDAEYIKLMCLSEHEPSPAVISLRHYLKNAQQFKSEAEAAERGPPQIDTASVLKTTVEEPEEEKRSPRGVESPQGAAFRALDKSKPGAASTANVNNAFLRPSEQFELRDKMNIKEKLTHFLATRKNDEQLVKMGVLLRGATFGLPLHEVVKLAGRDGVPNIVRTLVDFMKTEIIKLHGVFRISGENAEIQNLKRIYDYESEKELDLEKCGPHAITGCLKMFLRELPDPLFTFERYEPIVEAFRSGQQHLVTEIVAGLPYNNLQTWNYILDMLALCQSYCETNMMTAKNLSLVISPNILRMKIETFAKIAQDTPMIVGAVQHLIVEHAAKLGLLPDQRNSTTNGAEFEEKGTTAAFVTPVASVAPAAYAAPAAYVAPVAYSPPPVVLPPPVTAPPPIVEAKPEGPWKQYMDKASGQPYYYNKDTKETVWLKPADFN